MRKGLLNCTVSDNKLVLILPFQFLNNGMAIIKKTLEVYMQKSRLEHE